MKKKRVYLYLIFIILLAFFAFNLSYPKHFNQAIDFLNSKIGFKFPHFWNVPFKLGLDLQGGTHLVYEADLSTVSEQDKARAMAGLRDVIERRINIYGVTEPLVQIQGDNRLIVELAGVTNINDAIKMIGDTPYLEFLEERSSEETQKILDKQKEIEGKTPEEYQKIQDWQLAFENPSFKPTQLTGQYLKKALIEFDQTTSKPQIQLEFNSEGAKLFEEITARNIKKHLAIFLDGMSIVDTDGDDKITKEDLYAPVVQDKISGGKAVITGEINEAKAKEIAQRLNSGALPIKIGKPISQEIVGPTMGKNSLDASLRAGIYGFLAVILFIVVFYRLSGVLASLALVIYIVLILSLFKLISVTLTLAGIGGFILSIGMAVDANVLIFSRLREELRERKGFSIALEEGFRRSWPSIRDSNFTTIIVALMFFAFGTSFIKGFALTLIIGILISMFSAIFITRTLMRLFVGTRAENWKWLW